MGQSHNFFPCCGHVPSEEKYSITDHKSSPSDFMNHRRESGNDSGNSSAESLSPNRDSRMQRCSQSSESSGKFSFRGSISSPAESDPHNKQYFKNSVHAPEDLPVFCEGSDTDGINLPSEVIAHKRHRGSLSSVGHLGAIFFRSKSSSVSSRPWSKTVEEEDQDNPSGNRPRRAVSLRLPRSRHPKDNDTKVPTVYVDDEDLSSGRGRRRSSLREALSLLSLNSLTRELTSSKVNQKPVQKILRHPTRRHTTVRGISGLAIDGRSQGSRAGLQRAQTLVYYPTNTSLRTNVKPTYSNIVYA